MNDFRSISIITDSQADLISLVFDVAGEQFRYVGHCSKVNEVMREIGRDAANPLLVINWDDAAWIKQRLRQYFPGESIASRFIKKVFGK